MDFDHEHEPMDVDLSGNSIRNIDDMDISFMDITTTPIKIKQEPLEAHSEGSEENIIVKEIQMVTPALTTKRFTINIPQRTRRDHKTCSNTALSLIFIILTFISLLIYHIIWKFECSEELKLDVLNNSLTKNVIGQPYAIERVIESLKVESPQSSKILLFYGGTGVGKTFTTSLILENLYHYANIYHYTMPSFTDTFSADLMLGLTFCQTSMIIVDDLNGTDMHIKKHVENIIEKGEHLGKNITIILVFNCDTINNKYVKKCDDTFSLHLQQVFKEIKAFKMYIKFNSLTEEHLKKCIEKEMGGKSLSKEEFKNIAKHFNVSVDGCKGVYTKIKWLNIN